MDIARLGRLAASIGMSLAGNAKVAITVKTGPTPVHDTVTDTTTTTWAHQDQVQALVYDPAKEETSDGTNGPQKVTKYALIEGKDLTAEPTADTRVMHEGVEWIVAKIEADPVKASYTLTIRR